MRDSIGAAIIEFNEQTSGTPNTLEHTDCMARGRYCARIHKAIDNSSIEIYLDESDRSLNVTREGRASRKVCEYRITEDRKAAEFSMSGADGVTRATTPECACEMAIAEFIFTPFPASFPKS